VSDRHQLRLRRVGQFQRDFSLCQALEQPELVDIHDLFQVFLAQRVEHHDLVYAVEKLGTEVICASRPSPRPSCGRTSHRLVEPRYCRIRWLPMFEVMTMIVFLKSTTRP